MDDLFCIWKREHFDRREKCRHDGGGQKIFGFWMVERRVSTSHRRRRRRRPVATLLLLLLLLPRRVGVGVVHDRVFA